MPASTCRTTPSRFPTAVLCDGPSTAPSPTRSPANGGRRRRSAISAGASAQRYWTTVQSIRFARSLSWRLRGGAHDERARHLRLDRADRARRHHGGGARVPRHAAGNRRQESPSPLGAGRQRRRLGHADLRVSAVAARGDLGVRRRAGGAGRARGGGAMIVFLLVSYLVILFTLVKLKVVPLNLFWKLSPIVVLLVLTIALFIPMQWGAPQGPLMVVRHSVSIVPDVAGEVIDVPVEPNRPLKAGDVLFRIDPTPYESQLHALEAQFKLQEQRLGEVGQLE